MSSVVGLLKVTLASDTAEFSRGLDGASKRADRFGADLKKLGPIAASAFAAVGTAVAAMVSSTATAGDEIAKLSDRTGVTAESLSRLKYAAELSDVTMSDLETAFAGLSRRMLQAQDQTSAQAEAFSALGISTANADGSLRKVDDVLLDVADAFARSEDATAKAALAQELFGRSGASLLPLLNNGKRGIKEMGDEAERLGVVFSQDAADAAAEFNDNVTRLKSAAEGLKLEIGNALIPEINRLAGEFLAARRAGLTFWESLTRIGLSDPTKTYAEQLTRVRGEIEKTIEVAERQGVSDAVRARKLRELELLVKERAYYEELTGARKKASDAADEEADSTDKVGNAVNALAGEEERSAKASSASSAAASAQAAALAERNRIMAEGRSVAESLRTPIEKLYAEESRLGELFSANALSRDEYTRALDKAREAYWQGTEAAADAREEQERLNAMLNATPSAALEKTRDDMLLLAEAFTIGRIKSDEYVEAVQTRLGTLPDTMQTLSGEMDEFAKSAAQNIQSAFADFLFDPFKDGLDGMLKGFGQTIQRMIAEAVAADLANRLLGDMGSTGKIGGLAGQALSWLGGLASFDGGGYTWDGPRTGGLDGRGGRLALLHPQETVVDHTRPGGMGGATFIINQQLPSGTPAETRRAAAAGAREALSFINQAGRYA